MSCETVNTCSYDVGEYTHAGVLVLPLKAHQSGLHQLVFDFLETDQMIELPAQQGMSFQVENVFNENARVDFKIIQPDGTLYRFNELANTMGWTACSEDLYTFSLLVKPGFSLSEDCSLETMFAECADDAC